MPIYEYRCSKCRSKYTVLVRGWNGTAETVCPRCGATEAERLISSFAYHKSIKDIHEQSGEPGLASAADFYKDPRNIGRAAEKSFKEMGMDVPAEIREEIAAARDGVLPDSLTD